MSLRRLRPCVIGLVAVAAACGVARAGSPIGQLQAKARDGQVFLTWKEAETPQGTTFNVYLSDRPIGDLARARRGGITSSRTARDWWDRSRRRWTRTKPHGEPIGYRMHGGRRLDPRDGLFVHTVAAGPAAICSSP